MYRLFFTPEWFNGWDIVVDLVALVIALLIAGYSWRIYKINQENKFAYFSFAFALVSIGLFFKTFTSSILYFTPIRDVAADVLRPVAGARLSLSYIYYRGAFFIQMVSMLGAWLLIFFICSYSHSIIACKVLHPLRCRAKLVKYFQYYLILSEYLSIYL